MSPNRNVQAGAAIHDPDRTIALHRVPTDGTRLGIACKRDPGGRVAS